MTPPVREFLRGVAETLRRRHGEATPRERMLLAGLAVVGSLLLLSAGTRCLMGALRELRMTGAIREKRESLLAGAASVDADLQRVIAGPGARRTGADLLAALDAGARACGLVAESGTPVVERHGRTEIHKVRLLLRSAPMEKLLTFDERLREAGAGLCLDRVLLESREAEAGLSATYEITLCRIAE